MKNVIQRLALKTNVIQLVCTWEKPKGSLCNTDSPTSRWRHFRLPEGIFFKNHLNLLDIALNFHRKTSAKSGVFERDQEFLITLLKSHLETIRPYLVIDTSTPIGISLHIR